MLKKTLILASAAFAIPAAAQAQAENFAGPYVGANAAYHDFDVETDIDDAEFEDFGFDLDTGIDGFTFGGYAGYSAAVGDKMIVGVEGNAGFGTSSIDGEYGITGHVGFVPSEKLMLFARAGYQEINFDIGGILNEYRELSDQQEDEIDDAELEDQLGIDDTQGDYTVGVGAEFAAGGSGAFRLAVDTIAFDTLKLGAGYTMRF